MTQSMRDRLIAAAGKALNANCLPSTGEPNEIAEVEILDAILTELRKPDAGMLDAAQDVLILRGDPEVIVQDEAAFAAMIDEVRKQ